MHILFTGEKVRSLKKQKNNTRIRTTILLTCKCYFMFLSKVTYKYLALKTLNIVCQSAFLHASPLSQKKIIINILFVIILIIVN